MNDDRRAEQGFRNAFKRLHKRTKMTIIDMNSFAELVKKNLPADDALLMWACTVHLMNVKKSDIGNFDKHDAELRERLAEIRRQINGTAPPNQVVLWIFCHTNGDIGMIGRITDEIMGIARGRADQGPMSYWAPPEVTKPDCIERYVRRIRNANLSSFTPGNLHNDTEMTGLSTIRTVSLWNLIRKTYPVTPVAVYDMVCQLVDTEEDHPDHQVHCIEAVIKVAKRFGVDPDKIDPFPSQRVKTQYERDWSANVTTYGFRLPEEVKAHDVFARRRMTVDAFKRLVIEWNDPAVTYIQVLNLIQELEAWESNEQFQTHDRVRPNRGSLGTQKYAELICDCVKRHKDINVPFLRDKAKRLVTFIKMYAFDNMAALVLFRHAVNHTDDHWLAPCGQYLNGIQRSDDNRCPSERIPGEVAEVINPKRQYIVNAERQERERQVREQRRSRSTQIPAPPSVAPPLQNRTQTPAARIDIIGQKKPRSFDVDD